MKISVSLDGFVAGPDQSVENPLGVGGMFGGHPGPWDPATPWTGWWGPNPIESALAQARGERLFAGVDDLHGLELVRTVATPAVVHLKFARR